MRSEGPSEALGRVPMADEELKGGSARFVRGGIQDCPGVACFDTAFFRTMPQVAKLLPIPRRYRASKNSIARGRSAYS
jgi:Acetokinase family